ncbi:MAG: DUF4398 domain-containing protein [Treponema sp.]|nr:DUF4398 domain-containing protein [Treponema sp.]MCL2271510.1 DUF4398 domain-containing protein [Treponema sp.]
MKLKNLFFILITIFLAAGCAKPPIAEMENAREAVFRAENDNDAVLYGGSSLARARDALKRMQSEADSKRYDAARVNAAEAIAAAEKAIADGKTGVVKAKSDAVSAISGLKQEIDDTNRNVSAARYSLLDLDYNALDNSIRYAYSGYDQVEAAQAEGRYQDVVNKAMEVRSNLAGINSLVANAIPARKK